jgi:hypothetical protein
MRLPTRFYRTVLAQWCGSGAKGAGQPARRPRVGEGNLNSATGSSHGLSSSRAALVKVAHSGGAGAEPVLAPRDGSAPKASAADGLAPPRLRTQIEMHLSARTCAAHRLFTHRATLAPLGGCYCPRRRHRSKTGAPLTRATGRGARSPSTRHTAGERPRSCAPSWRR